MVVVVGVSSVAHGDVPKAENFAACNKQAQEAARSGGASSDAPSPNSKDQSRAADARRGNAPTDGTGTITRSPDPQLEGMDARGAADPVYQAAYRTCMRKSGF